MPAPYRIVIFQAAAALLVAAVMVAISVDQALSALAAGVVVVVPGGWYAWTIVRPATRDKRTTGARALANGVVRLFATVVLMALLFKFTRIEALGFFTAFALQSLMYVVGGIGAAAGGAKQGGPSTS